MLEALRPSLTGGSGADRFLAGPQPVTLKAVAATAKLTVRGGADVRARAGEVLGLVLPDRAYGSARDAEVEALWLGPDTWMLRAAPELGPALATRLEEALADLHHAVVDVGQQFVELEIVGERAADVLAAGCPIDLHPRAFPVGAVTRTMVGKVEVILSRGDGVPSFRLAVGRSFAFYAWRFLLNAAREFGYRVEVPPEPEPGFVAPAFR